MMVFTICENRNVADVSGDMERNGKFILPSTYVYFCFHFRNLVAISVVTLQRTVDILLHFGTRR